VGLVPWVERVKVKAESPLVKEPVPKGFMRVSLFELTEQSPGEELIAPLTPERVQLASSLRVIPEGN